VLGDEKRLRVLREVLERGETRTGDLATALGWPQPTVSRALLALAAEGLVANGNKRTPYKVVRPRETRWLLLSAALIEHAATGNPQALSDATALRKADMLQGADEDRHYGAPAA
jgi:DNA-binding transcriptional ArsR family regulator